MTKKDCHCFQCQLNKYEIPDTEQLKQNIQVALKHLAFSQNETRHSLERIGAFGDETTDYEYADNLNDFHDHIHDAFVDVFTMIRCLSTLGDVLSLSLRVIEDKLDSESVKH